MKEKLDLTEPAQTHWFFGFAVGSEDPEANKGQRNLHQRRTGRQEISRINFQGPKPPHAQHKGRAIEQYLRQISSILGIIKDVSQRFLNYYKSFNKVTSKLKSGELHV